MLETLLNNAIEQKASDIHFETYQNYFRVRIRIDGLLKTVIQNHSELWFTISTKIKVMANLNITEKRIPQDGKFKYTYRQIEYDCRVATCPTLYGEKIVIRILKNQTQSLTLEQIGLSITAINLLKKAVTSPGLIIFAGPTGSGKSTSLYALLNYLNTEALNIVTVEDPVEINLLGINQVNINPAIGLDFATVLKSFLRQDPDVIMIGEIRDATTAQIAIQAAYTGHLVLATLHTAFTAHVIMRLLDLKIAPIHLADTLQLVVAQRLFRKICPFCQNKIPNCPHCHKGYLGRFAIAELFKIEEDFKPLILKKPSLQTLQRYQQAHHFLTLPQLAKQQVDLGLTDLAELKRVLGYDAIS